MKMKLQVADVLGRAVSPLTAADGAQRSSRPTITFRHAPFLSRCSSIRHSPFALRTSMAFTLVEVLVVMTLLSLIVLSLMTVLNSTMNAFRAGITQTDVLESGRAVTDLIKGDLEGMTPSLGASNGAVNFYVTNNFGYTPLVQALPGGTQTRTNVLEEFFILTRENTTWTGVGYVVDPLSQPTNSLYRFSMSTNVMAADPVVLFNIFANSIANNNLTNMSHLMDGVVDLRVRAYDTNGMWMAIGYPNAQNVFFFPMTLGEGGFYMFSNTVPASVEVELGVLEDSTLQRAEPLPNVTPVWAQSNYLAQHVGQVHIFRQRAWIRNVDPSAYQ
jgi:type II secretory pathway pseudopilin PulG